MPFACKQDNYVTLEIAENCKITQDDKKITT